ncbi:hypothetical protein ACFE04_022161 [Oxalis oulophora]
MISNQQQSSSTTSKDVGDDVPMPGFRFHPTDEELLGFYLHRKVEKKPIKIELIKQIDIYKHDPWDLPKHSSMGDNEGYFFCKRGRKYRNSIRPNRVTGSGFWKATGIDKPVYNTSNISSSVRGRDDIIGLKKTLVFYRGSAGKGTKTDWMMHEFRLPPNINHTADKSVNLQEAEVWTLCRIFKRNVTCKKYAPESRDVASKRQQDDTISFRTYGIELSNCESYKYLEGCASFPHNPQQHDRKPISILHNNTNQVKEKVTNINTQFHHVNDQLYNWSASESWYQAQPQSMASNIAIFPNIDHHQDHVNSSDDFIDGSSWDDLRSVVEFAFHDTSNSC